MNSSAPRRDRDGTPGSKCVPDEAPMDVAVAVLWHKGAGEGPRILVTRRPPEAFLGGRLEYPGGKIEAGETIEAALRRELREEIAVEIGRVQSLVSVDYRYPDRSVRLHAMLAEVEASILIEHHAVVAHDWVPPQSLVSIDLPPANAEVTAAIVRHFS
jgi:8-oxo-dGTP diphosphatase